MHRSANLIFQTKQLIKVHTPGQFSAFLTIDRHGFLRGLIRILDSGPAAQYLTHDERDHVAVLAGRKEAHP